MPIEEKNEDDSEKE
jgi:hypothetical protein